MQGESIEINLSENRIRKCALPWEASTAAGKKPVTNLVTRRKSIRKVSRGHGRQKTVKRPILFNNKVLTFFPSVVSYSKNLSLYQK
jgi:hypothetical protein